MGSRLFLGGFLFWLYCIDETVFRSLILKFNLDKPATLQYNNNRYITNVILWETYMPKQVSITKEMVDRTAFELVRSKGMEALTARNIAEQAGCSTQPIYKIYRNLEELKDHVVEMATEHAENIIFHYDKTPIPFLNTGLGFIHFAATEKVLFRIFNIENYLSQPVFGPLEDKHLYNLMDRLLGDAPLSGEERRELFDNTMIYTNGLAHMAYAGQLNMTEQQAAQRLLGVFTQFAGDKWKGEIRL